MATIYLNQAEYDKALSYSYGDLKLFKKQLESLIQRYKSSPAYDPNKENTVKERLRKYLLWLNVTNQKLYSGLTNILFEGKGVDRYIVSADDKYGNPLSEDELNDIPMDIIAEYFV